MTWLHNSTTTTRAAVAADIPQLYDIWYANEVGDDPDPPPRNIPAVIEHELATGEIVVAEQDGKLVGFASVIVRGAIAFLAECFVRAEARSGGVGRQLVQQLLPRAGLISCTLSSTDPRALALYVRAGMRPAWPNFCLLAEAAQLNHLSDGGIEVVEALAGDPALVEWDTQIAGRHRPEDHAYWLGPARARPLWFFRDGALIGYGYAQAHSLEALWHPSAITLGPIGAHNPADAQACALAAARWARQRSEIVRITVPGPHAALPTLLEAGFRITYVETFLSASGEPFADVRCYIPSGSTLF
jgi:GNAT superfamily N-acetyltransferase